MVKNDKFTFRLSAETKKRLTKAAHGAGISLTEALIWSACSHFADHFMEMAKGYNNVEKAMPPSELRDKFSALAENAISEAEYFHRECEAIRESSEALKEIEGIELYRDFLRRKVAEETA